MSDANIDSIRKAFESVYFKNRTQIRRCGGGYSSSEDHTAWLTWQSATANMQTKIEELEAKLSEEARYKSSVIDALEFLDKTFPDAYVTTLIFSKRMAISKCKTTLSELKGKL